MSRARLTALLGSLAIGVAAGTLAAGASAAAQAQADVSTNWAGYVASTIDQTTGYAGEFSDVAGTWVQPAAKCGSAVSSTSSAFWVGLGGNSDTSNALEQIGTESDCSPAGIPLYSAWYELVPAISVKINLKVAAGDKISAAVNVTGTRVSVSMKNLTRGTSFARVLRMAAPDTTSAEWIAEAPSLCDGRNDCRRAPLTNFGKVAFSRAAATSNGYTGTISDPAWSASAIELDALGGGPGFGRFETQSTAAQALPGSLSANGAAFTVRWSKAASAAANPGYGSGYGPDGGYPGYGYG